MPVETKPEISPEKIMKQWYQGKLAERMMQAGEMSLDRELLRRGARKMQDGTLGQATENDAAEDDMHIHIGDQIITSPQPASSTGGTLEASQSTTAKEVVGSLAKQVAICAALALGAGSLGGVGTTWLTGAFDQPEAPVTAASAIDTDTQYELVIESGE